VTDKGTFRFMERFTGNRPLLLDGATGTELARRGVNLNEPSWTARAIRDHSQVLWQIHRDYVDAGAEIITANTFRTHARNLKSLEHCPSARDLTRQAVDIARDAAGPHVFVAGSIAPLEDCYSPSLTPSDEALLNEHAEMADNLAAAGVDLILVETQLTIREAVLAARGVARTGLPFGVSFVCNAAGQLLSGESLVDAVQQVAAWNPVLFLVNCIPVEEVLSTLKPVLKACPEIPMGAYANTGRLLANGSWEATAGNLPAVYAEYAREWIQAEFHLIGGCCGTTPLHISQVHKMICEHF